MHGNFEKLQPVAGYGGCGSRGVPEVGFGIDCGGFVRNIRCSMLIQHVRCGMRYLWGLDVFSWEMMFDEFGYCKCSFANFFQVNDMRIHAKKKIYYII